MWFFTRKGYEREIRRLQVANSDLIEQQIKLAESHQKQVEALTDRIVALGVPEVLRELRRVPGEPSERVPSHLKRPSGERKRFYKEPKSGIKNPSGPPPKSEDVEKIIQASLGRGS